MNDRIGNNHLGVEQGPLAQLPVKEPAMPVRPVHHGRSGYYMSLIFMHFFVMYQRSRVALFNLFLRYFSTQFATLLRLSAHGAHTTLPSYTCVSAWNKDPVSGVIGIQKGPL
jgi:hypothetical protein